MSMTNNYPYPVIGQKNAQGYTWNGAQYVSDEGYAQGSPEDLRKNRSGFRNLLSDLGGIGKDLTKAETWANPGGRNASGVLGSINAGNKLFNPFTSLGQAALEGQKGNYRGVASNLGIAAFKVAPFASYGKGGIAAARAGGATGAKAFTSAPLVSPISSFLSRGTKGKIASSVLGGLGVYGYGSEILKGSKPKTTASSAILPGRSYTMTPAQQAAMAAANQNRTDAAGNSGMGGRRVVGDIEVADRPSGGFPVTAPAAPAVPPVQLPLTPEQQAQYGEEISAINNLYKQTLAQIAQDEEQGQLGYARVGQAAQRQAAGSAQDIASQLAASGLAGSPASAFGAEQMVQAPLVQQRQSNRLNLDQLLAQLQKQRTQAGTAMDMSKVGLNRLIAAQRAANTASQVNAGYQNFLGGM